MEIRHDASHYNYSTFYNLDYDAYALGGVYTCNIIAIGSYGGLTVTELNSGSFDLDSSGKVNGNAVMMTFNAGGSGDHAIVVTGYKITMGPLFITYTDTTISSTGMVSQ